MDTLQKRAYPTFEAARKDIDDLARTLGYSFVIHRSNPNAKNPNRVILRCARGRSTAAHPYSNAATPPEKRRKSTSKMTNCPCRISVKLDKPLGNIPQPRYWYIDTYGGECSLAHNHEAAKGVGEFSRLRREAIETRKCYVIAMSAAGLSPTGIVAVLRQDVDEAVRTVTTHDVSNLVRKVKLEEEQKKAMAARGLNVDGTPLVMPQVPAAALVGGQARSLGYPHDTHGENGGQRSEDGKTGGDGVAVREKGGREADEDDNEQVETSIQHQLLAT